MSLEQRRCHTNRDDRACTSAYDVHNNALVFVAEQANGLRWIWLPAANAPTPQIKQGAQQMINGAHTPF